MTKKLHVAVRDLIAFLFPSGSLSIGSSSSVHRLREGSRLHREIQRQEEFQSEVSCSGIYEMDGIFISLLGRIDQLYFLNEMPVIREIKSTILPKDQINEDSFPHNWAQAMCYAAMLNQSSPCKEYKIELLYVHVSGKEYQSFSKIFPFSEIQDKCSELLSSYVQWQKKAWEWEEKRNLSLQSAPFPFPSLRKGQQELMHQVMQCIRDSSCLWAEAPTGIGKTMAVLFSSIQSMPREALKKIFYLTPKTAQQIHVSHAIEHLCGQGIKIRSIQLTAKEKICFLQNGKCDPSSCIYAETYYDRLMGAIKELLHQECFSSKDALEIAAKHRLCPFEFLLDASVWADIIIGDYNYFFDPRVRLKRYWDAPSYPAVVLVDEAHNLIDRAREMYSATVNKKMVWKVMKSLRKLAPEIYLSLRKIHQWFLNEQKDLSSSSIQEISIRNQFPEELERLLEASQKTFTDCFEHNPKLLLSNESIELYYDISYMLKLSNAYDSRYSTLLISEKGNLVLNLKCLDPSKELKETCQKSTASIFFSATLSPLSYFQDALGGSSNDMRLILDSPFPRNHLLSLLDKSISTRWKDRPGSLTAIKDLIHSAVSIRKGNYMAYFPSYQYLNDVAALYHEQEPFQLMIQKTGMKEIEKKAFIDAFQTDNEKTLLALAVLGGSFAEGIDLVGEKLNGVIIIGVGLPKISPERELIRKYYDETKESGYNYAYLYPGMNKVMQAGGRVIRSSTDKGFILLVDDRFYHSAYGQLIPQHWKPLCSIKNHQELKDLLEHFWE